MPAWPTLFVAMDDFTGEFVCIAATATKARRMAEAKFDGQECEVSVEEVPLCDPVKVLRIPRGALPGSSPAPALASPIEEPVAPARRSDPETAKKAAAAARRLGPNARTRVLRWIVAHDPGLGFTESEVSEGMGLASNSVSKRLGELESGAWLYVKGTRTSRRSSAAQQVYYPTNGALQWVAENPASESDAASAGTGAPA